MSAIAIAPSPTADATRDRAVPNIAFSGGGRIATGAELLARASPLADALETFERRGWQSSL